MDHDPMRIMAGSPTASGAASLMSLSSLAANTVADVAHLLLTARILLQVIAHRAPGPDGAATISHL